ncbi:hypothetical protein [Neorhodopirellula lusitana]|uniref:hypothetical protein n=1 Tax=Neorhodopirellula lusitana TaxID=445327 RepID=UPI00384CDAF6
MPDLARDSLTLAKDQLVFGDVGPVLGVAEVVKTIVVLGVQQSFRQMTARGIGFIDAGVEGHRRHTPV